MRSTLTSSSALLGLKAVSLNDFSDYASVLQESKPTGSSYYLPGLLSYHRPGHREILLAEDEGSICIYRWESNQGLEHLDIYLAPTPMNTSVLRRCVERVNDFNQDRSARIFRIDEADAKAVASIGFRIRKRREQYIFEPRKYSELGGKELYTVRRNVSRIEKLGDVRIETYTPEYAESCHALLKDWRSNHRERHGSAGGYGSSKRIIDLAGHLPESALTGQVVLINDQLVAFSFGGRIHSKLACSLERKCVNQFTGLTYFQLRNFLLHLSDYQQVNDGSDAGRPGLKQLKDSFRPVGMHAEYRGYQK
ncbi:MAG: phosphatidylglycerol lysyltransferase domain-containing protein [Chromatiales bacterium]|jgi:hypothetical protein